MFEKLKTIFKGAGLLVKHGDLIHDVVTAWTSYPGLENPEKLRTWLRPLLLDATTLALMTKTPIDDAITLAAMRIVDHDRSWNAIHAMALLVRDGGLFQDGVLIPESTAYQNNVNDLNDVAKEILPNCPVLVHAAVGLLLLILQRRTAKP